MKLLSQQSHNKEVNTQEDEGAGFCRSKLSTSASDSTIMVEPLVFNKIVMSS